MANLHPCVLLIELGDAVMHAGRLRSGVSEALVVLTEHVHIGLLARAEDAQGRDALLPVTESLRALGLSRFFEPAAQHVLVHAEPIPGRHVFQDARSWVGTDAEGGAIVLVTAREEMAKQARALGIHVLRFGPGGQFDEWEALPLLVLRELEGGHDARSLLPALNLRLEQRFGLSLSHIESIDRGRHGRIRIAGIVPTGGGEDGLSPMSVTIELAPDGDVATLIEPGAREEAEAFHETLEQNRQVAGIGDPLEPGMTHVMEESPEGELRPVRKRFSIG
ncbi:hypothetical protein [Polyangium sp. y55x31]|uniref:hypothetical protein n=1 Tax=Polyangium sp. y55x31 TaxID=3042688 RepID=UPI0024821EAB|nr:hypothetical protein [Polyangium sp. y55x31]MDI1480340.1 hypothetical protein [Polyangium sp. y55x31]